MDQGLGAVSAWLKPLFRPYATAAYQVVRVQHGLPALPTPTPSPPPSAHILVRSHYPLEGPADFIPITSTIGHLALFNQYLQKDQRTVEWVYSGGPSGGKGAKTTPVWAVRVLVDGEPFGHGSGNTKKAARNEAAKEGLDKMGIVVW
jgi:ribonuclease III